MPYSRFFSLTFLLTLATACGEGGVSAPTSDGTDPSATDSQEAPDNHTASAPPRLVITQAAHGRITASPAGPYTAGATVTLTATPDADFDFDAWSGVDVSDNPTTLVLTEDTTVSATFTKGGVPPLVVNVVAQPGATVTVTPPGAHYVGDMVTVSVAVQPGYALGSWSDGGSGLERLVTLTGDLSLTANIVPVPVLTGPTSHTGNETNYTLSWTYASAGVSTLTGYVVEESYQNAAFVSFNSPATSGTTYTLSVPVNRDPGRHCYRVRARLGFAFSPYSNTHCVQRMPGEKRIRIVNDVASWVGSSGAEYNGIIRVHAGTGDVWSLPNLLEEASASLPGGLVGVGQERSFSTASQPSNYAVGFAAGWWEYVCIGACRWERHLTQVTGCDMHTLVYKAQVVNVVNHDYDTYYIYMSQWLPRGNYGACQDTTCVRDPVCVDK